MNQPKFGAAGKIKKADEEVAIHQISETLKSIEIDFNADRLDADEKTHGFHRITAEDEEKIAKVEQRCVDLEIPIPPWKVGDLSTQSIASLLFHRLKAQGYTLYFDEKVIAETLEKARARLGSLLD